MRKISTVLFAAGFFVCQAHAQVSEAEREALIEFYHATGGDEWHWSGGWLDGIDACLWDGVTCGADWSSTPGRVTRIHLSGNNLSGQLPDELADLEFLEWLIVGGNNLEGSLPARFEELRLKRLDLSNNRFTGSVSLPLAALDTDYEYPLTAYLHGNRFSGSLPEDFPYERFASAVSSGGSGGINLCWNPIETPRAEIYDLIASRHQGGSFAQCLSRERIPVSPTLSGSWYDPGRSGEGFTQMLLPNGDAAIYYFTFGYLERFPHEPNQRWYFSTSKTREFGADMGAIHTTVGGKFGLGFHEEYARAVRKGWVVRADRVDEQSQHVYYRAFFVDEDCHGSPCAGDSMSERYDQIRLTRLAGTSCDNQQPHQAISGLWYDPERSGEGFVVEVIEDGRGLAYWFTHTPDDSGRQAWMMGDGEFDGSTLYIDNLIQPVGGSFGPDFDPADVDRVHWGSLTLEFFDGSSGHIYWDSVFEEYGAGDYPIQRLARAKLAECEVD